MTNNEEVRRGSETDNPSVCSKSSSSWESILLAEHAPRCRVMTPNLERSTFGEVWLKLHDGGSENWENIQMYLQLGL